MSTYPRSTQLRNDAPPDKPKRVRKHKKDHPTFMLYCARCGQWTSVEGGLLNAFQGTGVPILCAACAIDETTDFPTSINDTF